MSQEIGLYLDLRADAGALARLEAVSGVVRPRAVLLRPAPGGRLEVSAARGLIEAAQALDAAALIEGDARLARTLRADGVHLPWRPDVADAYAEAREILGRGWVVGVSAGASRHDAMTLGEAGADYVGFGEEIDEGQRDELIAWWAEVFEVPCVAFGATSAAEASRLATLGAEFLAVPLAAGELAADAADRVRAIVTAVGAADPVSRRRG